MFQLPNPNAVTPVEDLIRLNVALREFSEGNFSKAGSVGYQTPAGLSGTTNLSALVPQSIESQLAIATFTTEQLVFWPALPKRPVANTLHEYNIVKEHGLDLDPFMAEGAAGTVNSSEYERAAVRIKYLAERREVTDVATMVGLIGDNTNAIAEETERGTLRLMGKLEKMLFFADSSLSSLHFDGVFKQVESKAAGNVTDLEGKDVTPQLLQGILGQMCGAPLFGRPDCIYVESRVHASLIAQTVAFGRHDQVKAGETGITFGTNELFIMGPYGKVPIKMAPFLYTAEKAPSAASSATAPVAPVISVGTPPVTPADAASKFKVADAGDYIYKFVGFGDAGYCTPIVSDPISVLAGDKVVIEIHDAAKTVDGDNKISAAGVRYYKVYRSDKDGDESTCKFLKDLTCNELGTASDTQFTDKNLDKPNTSKILITQHTPDVIQFVRLLDFLRRPLAEVATKKPFLLMLFGALIVKVPTKCWVVKNVGSVSSFS